jgi:hypothetical protein
MKNQIHEEDVREAISKFKFNYQDMTKYLNWTTREFYKIVDYNVNTGEMRTLFHSHNGENGIKSRRFPVKTWLKAIIRPVRDGSESRMYLAGFHFFEKKREAVKYLERFKKPNLEKSPWVKAVVRVYARNIWTKTHSRSKVYLSEHMYILTNAYVAKQELEYEEANMLLS